MYFIVFVLFLKKKLNASRPSERPPVRGKDVKTFLGGIIGCNTKPLFVLFCLVFLHGGLLPDII